MINALKTILHQTHLGLTFHLDNLIISIRFHLVFNFTLCNCTHYQDFETALSLFNLK
jgi:hypothetical protein